MSKIQFPYLEVVQSLYELTEDFTPNRFIGSRPPATREGMQDFLLIDIDGIENKADTYQLARGWMMPFVRDVQGGLKNVNRLQKLNDAIVALFPIRTQLYLATRPKLITEKPDGAGFHSLIIQFGIRIHKDFDIHPKETTTL